MLIAACMPNKSASPAVAKRVNGSSSRSAMASERSTTKANSATMARHRIEPNSSAATAKMKSAWLSGRMRLTVPSPGPRPSQPPEAKLPSAVSIWKPSWAASGLRNLSMRLVTCGTRV